MLYTSTVYHDGLAPEYSNNVTVELTTPTSVAPDSMLFCLNDTSIKLDAQNFKLWTVKEGGSIFSYTETLVFGPGKSSSIFFQPRQLPDPYGTEFGTVYDVLSTDPFYAKSYITQRWGPMQA